MGTVCLVSSRQIDLIPMQQLRDDSHRFVLIISREEQSSLAAATLDAFSAVFAVRMIGSDGVLWRYDPGDVAAVIDNLGCRPLALITFDEGQTLLVAQMRERFGVDGATVAEVERYRNKLSMKACVKGAGLRVPAAEGLPRAEEWPTYAALAERIGPHLVIKPVSSAGTNAVDVVRDESEFERTRVVRQGGEMAFEAEEYIAGRLFHCDTIWTGATLRFRACTEYVGPTVDFQYGAPLGGRAMPPGSPLTSAITEFCVASVRALGIRGVAQHTEVIVGPCDEITFVESGSRPPGMLVAQMYEKAFGVNIIEETMAANLSRDDTVQSMPLPVRLEYDAFYLVYPKRSGVVSRVNEPPIENQANVVTRSYSLAGETHFGCRSNLDFVGTALAWGEVGEMDDTYEAMKHYQPIEYHP